MTAESAGMIIVQANLVPRPPPRLNLAAVEAYLQIKSGWRPGYEVSTSYSCITGFAEPPTFN